MTDPYRPPDPDIHDRESEADAPPTVTFSGGFRSHLKWSAGIAALGAGCNYLFAPFPQSFFTILVVIAILTALCVTFSLDGVPLSGPKRVSKAITPAFFGLLGIAAIVSVGVTAVRAFYENVGGIDPNLAADSFFANFVLLFLVFFVAVLFVMLVTSGSMLARYNE